MLSTAELFVEFFSGAGAGLELLRYLIVLYDVIYNTPALIAPQIAPVKLLFYQQPLNFKLLLYEVFKSRNP
ncbi:hypothetical protein NBRC116495_05760 [Aurantivibrio plasticivorans]